MGFPRFFRWVAERWPCVCQTLSLESPPPTDNLFFNLNSVLQEAALHAGGHGDTQAIFEHIEYSIEKLVRAVKPQSLILLTMDGVVPKAKLMRHRSTKFRNAENMKLASAAAGRRGEVLKTFDLNALTAGTEFMVDLMQRLKKFIQKKVSQDSAWPPKVIFSGSNVPGEADHKILDYLRNVKNSVEWQPNQRHAFYGLEASTLISALVIHEPHCYLFKEKSSKTKGSKGPAARPMLEKTIRDEFMICSIGLLRDYLQLEFESQLPQSFELDIERAVDDFVLLCIISGNDFLPGLESFSGIDSLMENLMESYVAMLPSLGGYITQIGRINGERLQKVLEHCAITEEAHVRDQLKIMSEAFTPDKNPHIDRDFLFLSNRAAKDILNEVQIPERAICSWKDRHYHEKLQIPRYESQAVVKEYFEGLNWAMRCFYRGLPSWSWFYPHHYAPMMSDMKDMDPAKVLFRMGNPVSSLFHLMSVIPRASYKLVPRILQPFITDPKSPLTDYYPNDCRVDLEGKRMDWDAVVLLPFLDEKKLGAVLSRISQARLSEREMECVRVGHALTFSSNQGLICVHFSPSDPSACNGNSSCGNLDGLRKMLSDDIRGLDGLKVFRSELPAGTLTGVYSPPGYWTLRSLKVIPRLKKLKVCLFSYPSERSSLQLSVLPAPCPDASPESLIGKSVLVEWPSLRKARVVRVEDEKMITEKRPEAPPEIFTTEENQQQSQTPCSFPQRLSIEEWRAKTEKIAQRVLLKQGVDVGRIDVLVTVKRINGALRYGLDHLVEQYGPEEVYPLQVLMLDGVYPNHAPDAMEEKKLSVSAHDRLLYVGSQFPGTVATVLEPTDPAAAPSDADPPLQDDDEEENDLETTTDTALTGEGVDPCTPSTTDDCLLVSIQVHSPAALASLRAAQKTLRSSTETYYPSGAVATRLGVTPQGLSRITGSLWVNTGTDRQEIGLAVKLGSKNMCVAGYVRPSSNGTGWEYTESLVSILERYKAAFRWVFQAVDATPEGGEISLRHVFVRSPVAALNEMVARAKEWLNALPLTGRPLVAAEAHVGSIAAIEQAQATLSLTTAMPPPVTVRLLRSDFIPPPDKSSVPPKEAGGEMEIGDFVAYIGSSLISFGSPGVVIGTVKDQAEVLFSSEVLHSVSIFGSSTKQYSCLVNVIELVNITTLTGEHRPKQTLETTGTATPSAVPKNTPSSQRFKSNSVIRAHGHSASHSQNNSSSSSTPKRRVRSSWNGHGTQAVPELSVYHLPALQDPGCMIRPVMAVPYGSGVYIPGMSPMPGVQGAMPSHPMPFANYSRTPRY